MKKLFLLTALFVAAMFSACSHDDCEPIDSPDKPPLAIAFDEGNSLQFDVGETKTVHYTITGGSDKTVVKAEMQKSDGAYTVKTMPISATEGTIKITAKKPTDNCVLVSVSDGSQTFTTVIVVSAKPDSQELAIAFAEGDSLQFDVDETKIVHYTITGGSDKTVVKAKMQKSNGAYTVETKPTSTTKGTITITAKTPSTDNCVIVTVSDGDRSITAEIAVSTNPIPEELAIAFAEGNSLQFDVGETKTVHYTITGGSDNTVVKAEMQIPDDAYTVETTPTSATEGTIAITAKTPSTDNCVIVTVSDGDRSITAEITVTVILKASFDGKTVVVVTPGTLSQLLAGYDKTKITELTVIGNLNGEDIATLKNLPNLAILNMENANLEELPSEAFNNNKSLTSVKLPKTLKTIGERAFSGCSNLTSITIPDSVTTIGQGAFSGCSSLTSITIPDSVTSIGKGAFFACGLISITIPDSVTEIGERAFYYCGDLTIITIGNSVTTIGQEAFYECGSLTIITIGNSVTTIGQEAFYDCSSLKSITIGNSVTTIGNSAFEGCRSLKSITIPDSVTTIGNSAFDGCRSLTSVTIGNSVTTIGNHAFAGCSSLTSVTIGNSVTTIGKDAFAGCSSLTNITIPDSVTTIGDRAFADCTSLTAFYGKFASSDNRCLIVNGRLVAFAPAGLISYIIPDSVTEIGSNAFSSCSSLTSIMIPKGVTKIGDSAFWRCESLTSITIPKGVTEIGSYAFDWCSSLKSITIPDSVTTIGNHAFDWCSGLTSIYCKAQTPPSIGSYGLGYHGSATLYVPTGCKAAYAAADGWKNFTKIIETQF